MLISSKAYENKNTRFMRLLPNTKNRNAVIFELLSSQKKF